ncbi:nucleoside monophosphate kinase [Candidatus Haliotispira prima]|uniref:Adenylate kinase n=1 Tax=Candidatus Haliotispira prima TaxID=3034016 RepID=A0ABY8MHZ7_9SPIO|nr:nucleoside monophosphate kinase [Candidatus Haliotispira prima]
MKIMLLGTPGSGKGTLAQSLSSGVGLPHISTGDIFRAAIHHKTKLGLEVKTILASGKLVPDELTCSIVFERLTEPDARQGFLLDGFPRTIPQAETFDRKMELDSVILLELDEETNVTRLTERLICPDCGAIYHRTFRPPQKADVCDTCGGTPVQRPDDQIEVVNKRLEEYYRLTAPLIRHYEDKQKIHRFNALQSPAALLHEVQSFLQNL